MSYTRRELTNRQCELREAGLDVNRGTVQLHNAAESNRHLTVKALLGLWIRRAGRAFATEVEFPDGSVADVLDFGPPDGQAVVYEVESNPDTATTKSKVKRYTRPAIIRDCVIIDIGEAPAEIDDLAVWVRDTAGI